MFKKLEDDKKLDIAAEETPEGVCICTCGEPTESVEEARPEKTSLVSYSATRYEVSG